MVASRGIINVLIADDHPLIRVGIRQILYRTPDIAVIGEASNGQEAIQLVYKLSPDVLILDLQMPVMDGFQVLETLNKEKANVCTLVLSAYDEKHFASEAMVRGAWGYFRKEEAPAQLIDAIHRVAEAGKKERHSWVPLKGYAEA